MLHHLLGFCVARACMSITMRPERLRLIWCLAENGKIPKKVLQSTDEYVCYPAGTCIFLAASRPFAISSSKFLAEALGRSLAIDDRDLGPAC